jgi:two-component system LytT family sensor kinase
MPRNNSRFIYMFISGLAAFIIMSAISPFQGKIIYRIIDFILCISVTVVLWEGNLRIDNYLNSKLPWDKQAGKRIIFHSIFSITFSTAIIYASMFLFGSYLGERIPIEVKNAMMEVSLLVGITMVAFMSLIEICLHFFKNWKQSLIEVEKYKTESALAQLQNLKNQIDPHFLFNNMNILSSLVYTDANKAAQFINQLSIVYRYLLDNNQSELVTLKNELDFIKSYIYLLEIRFQKNIHFNLQIPESTLGLSIPPMALQMLIENAIKHNEISEDFPLTISIIGAMNELTVSNNFQPRRNHESNSKTGLQNIKNRYKFYTNTEVEIAETINTFAVKIPLLKSI